jgi:hypothetical protein
VQGRLDSSLYLEVLEVGRRKVGDRVHEERGSVTAGNPIRR